MKKEWVNMIRLSILNISNAFSSLLTLAGYVLMALGMYTIAKRRGIRHAWLAWVPVANLWLLGCVSDQYQQVVFGKQKTKRRTMMWLYAILLVLAVIVVVMAVDWFIGLLNSADIEFADMIKSLMNDPIGYAEILANDLMAAEDYLVDSLGQLMTIGGLALVLSIVSTILLVLQYMAVYDVFRSCDPMKAGTYLALSVVLTLFGFGIVQSVLVFVCRDKDLGMPPRTNQIPEEAAVWQPPQPPVQL